MEGCGRALVPQRCSLIGCQTVGAVRGAERGCRPQHSACPRPLCWDLPEPNRARVSPHSRGKEEEEEEECFSVSSLRRQEEKCWSSGSRDEGAETEERSRAAASAAAAAAAARGDGHRSCR